MQRTRSRRGPTACRMPTPRSTPSFMASWEPVSRSPSGKRSRSCLSTRSAAWLPGLPTLRSSLSPQRKATTTAQTDSGARRTQESGYGLIKASQWWWMFEHLSDVKDKDSAQPEKICGSLTKAEAFPGFTGAQEDCRTNPFQVAGRSFTTNGNLQRISDGVLTAWQTGDTESLFEIDIKIISLKYCDFYHQNWSFSCEDMITDMCVWVWVPQFTHFTLQAAQSNTFLLLASICHVMPQHLGKMSLEFSFRLGMITVPVSI